MVAINVNNSIAFNDPNFNSTAHCAECSNGKPYFVTCPSTSREICPENFAKKIFDKLS